MIAGLPENMNLVYHMGQWSVLVQTVEFPRVIICRDGASRPHRVSHVSSGWSYVFDCLRFIEAIKNMITNLFLQTDLTGKNNWLTWKHNRSFQPDCSRWINEIPQQRSRTYSPNHCDEIPCLLWPFLFCLVYILVKKLPVNNVMITIWS